MVGTKIKTLSTCIGSTKPFPGSYAYNSCFVRMVNFRT